MNEPDLRHLRRALTLAARGRFRTSPNPRVGAVIVGPDGEVVGEGYHREVGGPHAEAEALGKAGDRARGATLYVTLEPCSHHGRTPPCAEATINAGVTRVVACHRDPNPQVSGRGLARLRAAGIEVQEGFLVEEAVRLNWRFLVAQTAGRPAVTVKWAMSLDGKIATSTGQSQWISSPDGRRWGVRERETHDAILVGSGTALADDPRLNRRSGRGGRPLAGRPNVRVVLDRRLRLEGSARLFDLEGEVLIYTRPEAAAQQAARREALQARGGTVVALDDPTPAAVLADLHRREIASVLVEGGAGVAGAFVEAGLFDRIGVDLAPILIGGIGAPGPLGGNGIAELAKTPRLDGLRAARRGQDLIITGFRQGCLPALSAIVAS